MAPHPDAPFLITSNRVAQLYRAIIFTTTVLTLAFTVASIVVLLIRPIARTQRLALLRVIVASEVVDEARVERVRARIAWKRAHPTLAGRELRDPFTAR